MNRLTPEIVAAAFDQIGKAPVRMRWGSQADPECDGLYAAAAAKEMPLRKPAGMPPERYIAELLGVSGDYVKGFTWGWDCQFEDPNREWSTEARQGFLDGRAAWLAVGEGKEARRA